MEQLVVKDRVIGKDIIDILYDIQKSCKNGKLSHIRVSGTGIAVTCPSHNGGQEKHPSCFINIQNEEVPLGMCHCFTCGFKGSFSKFVGECFNRDEEYGENWLLSNYGTDYVKKEFNLEKIKLHHEKIDDIDESILDTFESYHPYMTQRKISNDIIEKFKIKYDPKSQCIVFPVRDRYGKLKYLTRRSVNSKMFMIDGKADKSNIFGLSEIIKDNCREVVVCESQINALTSWSYGHPAIALIGAGTTKEQMNELNNTGVRHWILAYDGDDAGDKGANRFISMARKDVFIDKIEFNRGQDLNDLSKDEFEVSLQNAKRII